MKHKATQKIVLTESLHHRFRRLRGKSSAAGQTYLMPVKVMTKNNAEMRLDAPIALKYFYSE